MTPNAAATVAEIELEFLFESRVRLQLPPLNVGAGPEGHRVIYLVKGGTFEGPKMKGRIVPDSGADWVRVRPDGSSHLDVRFCLETVDGAILFLHWHGRFWTDAANADYARDFAKPDDPAGAGRYYFRSAPEFETADPRYAWLNRIVAIATCRTGDGGVIHRVYAVK